MLSNLWLRSPPWTIRSIAGLVALVTAVLLLSSPLPAVANDHNNGANQGAGQASRFRSVDDATGYIREQHPGAKIVKVVRKKQADGSHIALFRILTADGRMKKISVNID